MPDDDPAFSARIRSTRGVPRPLFIDTVGAAVDLVDDLPEGIRALAHWQQARSILYEAYDPPHDATKVKAAEDVFRAALKKQRWL
jgi:hypothetical protein